MYAYNSDRSLTFQKFPQGTPSSSTRGSHGPQHVLTKVEIYFCNIFFAYVYYIFIQIYNIFTCVRVEVYVLYITSTSWIFICVRECFLTHTNTHTHMCVCVCVNMYMYKCVCVRVCSRVCMRVMYRIKSSMKRWQRWTQFRRSSPRSTPIFSTSSWTISPNLLTRTRPPRQIANTFYLRTYSI